MSTEWCIGCKGKSDALMCAKIKDDECNWVKQHQLKKSKIDISGDQ